MKKNIKLLAISTVLAFALSGCSDSDSGNNTSNVPDSTMAVTADTTEAVATEADTTEAVATEATSTETVSYSNSGNSYTLNVDSFVSFKETTTHPTSSVNNEDGLEINYGDVYITIQRYPTNSVYSNVDEFYTYLQGDQFLSMVVAEDAVSISNAAVVECKNQTIEMKSGNTVFAGYLYYFKTEEGFYKAMISGSDLEVIEHYKNFVDNMTFNK